MGVIKEPHFGNGFSAVSSSARLLGLFVCTKFVSALEMSSLPTLDTHGVAASMRDNLASSAVNKFQTSTALVRLIIT